MSEPILEVEGLSKEFFLYEQQKRILSSSNTALKVYPGKLTALIGPTGSGKSSILKTVYRTYLPTAGEIIYTTENGKKIDLTTADDHTMIDLRKNEIGFVTQFLHHLPRQQTLDVVAQPLYYRGVSREEGRLRAAEILADLNIPEHLWEISPATFSGGERQRVNLARGIISKSRLLLLDEPTASLDPKTTKVVVKRINEMKAEGVGMLAVFHDMKLVEELGDHVVELQKIQY